MKQAWPIYTVRYWSHESYPHRPLNDCWGNSQTWTGKARTPEEARRKAKQFVEQFTKQFRHAETTLKSS